MRILDLELIRFGCFTDEHVDLSAGEEGFHLVYGLNEAGKSSALRSLVALLYGIPPQSPDSFLHEYARMRVGGRLRAAKGDEISFVRRKGTRDTVLGSDGHPLAGDVLSPFLQGVDERQFTTVFGIDHKQLVSGGTEIALGKGDVGQALFAAGIGSAGVRKALQELDGEAEQLFKPGGRNPPLNQALSRYRNKKQEYQGLSQSPRDWEVHDRALAQSREALSSVAEQIGRLTQQKSRLEALRAIFPALAKRNELRDELAAMGHVTVLRADFEEDRRRVSHDLAEAKSRAEEARQAITKLTSAIDELETETSDALLAQQETIDDLYLRLGGHRKAAADRPRLQGELEQSILEGRNLRQDLPAAMRVRDARIPAIDVAQRASIRALAAEHQGLKDRSANAQRSLQAIEEQLESARASLSSLPPTRDPRVLAALTGEAQQEGDLEAAVARTEAELAETCSDIERRLRQLNPSLPPDTDISMLPLPLEETIIQYDGHFQSIASGTAQLDSRLDDLAQEDYRLHEQLKALLRSGEIPTEGDLTKARQHRDHGWQLVRRAWLAGEDVTADATSYDSNRGLPEAYEDGVSQADAVADRLRQEADRVAEQSQLTEYLRKCSVATGELEAERDQLAQDGVERQRQWDDLWQAVGITPLSPGEMRVWLARADALRQMTARKREMEGKMERLTATALAQRRSLSDALKDVGYEDLQDDVSLSSLVRQSQDLVEEMRESARSRRDLEKQIGDLELTLNDSKREERAALGEVERWETEWGDALEPVGMPATTLPAAAISVIELLQDLTQKAAAAEELQSRISGIDRDAERFTRDVSALVKLVAPEAVSLPPDQSAVQLNTGLVQARESATLREELRRQIARSQAALEEAERQTKQAVIDLGDLCREAGVAQADDLRAAELRSEDYQRCRQSIEEIEEQLIRSGGGKSLKDLDADARSVDVDAIPGDLATIDVQLRQLEEERSELDQRIGEERRSLALMDGREAAADAAADCQQILAAVSEQAEHYARVRIAAALVRRGIEEYRQQHQDPVLLRASQLFSRLTLGSFAGVQSDFDQKDRPVLVGERSNGGLVGVEGMSDGTLDQLFLALRLATLERHCKYNEPMPLVVDDILIRFDDDRARGALEVLTELAETTQVVFFTHHHRLLELAQDMADRPCGVTIHELARPAG